MTMSNADAKKAAFAALSFRTASSGSMSDDVRTSIGATVGGPTWPPTAGTALWEVKDLLNDMGYTFFEDYSITRDTTANPTSVGSDASSDICVILYLALLNPGSIYSGSQSVRDALWATLSSSNQTFLTSRFTQWGYTVAANKTVS